MKEYIYLAGQISVDYEITYRWRQEVREYFKDDCSLIMIDPCDNGFNDAAKAFDKDIDGDPIRERVYKTKGIDLIVPKDKGLVIRSTAGIANLNHYDKDKLIIGTLFELAWYTDHPEKAVVGVFDGDHTSDQMCNHPFVRRAVTTWCSDHMEAAEVLKYYYKNGVS
jgi:hypothetical protein